MWWKGVVTAVLAVVLIGLGVVWYGAKRWQSKTRRLLAEMDAARSPILPGSYEPAELENLPLPVQRYFRTVLKAGQPLVAAARVKHTGTFNLSETGEQWAPFKSAQRVVTRRPGFVWDARIRMAPGMNIFVHDAYVAGEGVLTAKPFGLLTVMEQPSSLELTQGELMRFLAEGTWYPTALLPSQGVVWEAIDDTQARATLADGQTEVSLVFQFDAAGLVSAVRSDGRYREVGGLQVPTPWQGRFWDYQWRDGMLVPLEGEVGWMLAEGEKPYWRGRIEHLEYEYAP
jgi:hypothetical protein